MFVDFAPAPYMDTGWVQRCHLIFHHLKTFEQRYQSKTVWHACHPSLSIDKTWWASLVSRWKISGDPSKCQISGPPWFPTTAPTHELHPSACKKSVMLGPGQAFSARRIPAIHGPQTHRPSSRHQMHAALTLVCAREDCSFNHQKGALNVTMHTHKERSMQWHTASCIDLALCVWRLQLGGRRSQKETFWDPPPWYTMFLQAWLGWNNRKATLFGFLSQAILAGDALSFAAARHAEGGEPPTNKNQNGSRCGNTYKHSRRNASAWPKCLPNAKKRRAPKVNVQDLAEL